MVSRFLKRFLIIVAVLNSGLRPTEAFHDLSKSSLNYGLVFRHHQTVRVTQALWRVTFTKRLPNLDMHEDKPFFNSSMFTGAAFTELSMCTPKFVGFQHKIANCAKYIDNVAFIREAGIRAQRTLAALSNNIKNTLPRELPREWLNERVINTRSLLPIISQFGKSLFGFSTEIDVNSLRTAVNELIKNQEVHEKTLKSSTEHLASFAGSVNNEFERILRKINTN